MKIINFLLCTLFISLLISCDKDEPLDFQEETITKTDFFKVEPNLHFTLETNNHKIGPMSGGSVVFLNGKLWHVAGQIPYPNPTSPNFARSSSVFSSMDGKEWEFIVKNRFPNREIHSLLVFDDKLWVIGGLSNSGINLKDIWTSKDGNEWELVTEEIPDISTFDNAIVFNNRIFV